MSVDLGGRRSVLITGGVILVLLVVLAVFAEDLMIAFFGPPRVTMQEAYEERTDGPVFDHSMLQTILEEHVDAAGRVDYAELALDPVRLDEYIIQLGQVRFADLGRSEKLALLINAYNAFTLRLILDHWNDGQLASIKDIPRASRWEDQRWQIGKRRLSLNQIEHEEIRGKFAEPRIHFALVCAAKGCPPLRAEAYTGARLEEQFQDQTMRMHGNVRWLQYEASASDVRIRLTSLYRWYAGDFEQAAGSVQEFAARYCPLLAEALQAGREPRVEWLSYDWSLNRR